MPDRMSPLGSRNSTSYGGHPQGEARDRGSGKQEARSIEIHNLQATALTSWADGAKLIHSGHQPGPAENLEGEKKASVSLGTGLELL